MGKGARRADNTSFENNCATHGAPLGGDAYVNTVKNLGGDVENPFVFFDETKEIYARREQELNDIVAKKRQQKSEWEKANPELALKMSKFFAGENPTIDWNEIVQKPDQATRAASANVLAVLGQKYENMIVASADLSNSDKTDGFLKVTKPMTKDDFSGAFLQAGVSELTMACVCIGMALHGGVVAACATFFVFSDYMKPAIRMAALMELPVKFIWSHDAFRVGEDGPTHEPVEQEAQIRLMEKVKNHHGRNAMLVLRPADVEECTACYKLMMENKTSPTGIILSRQNIKNLPENSYEVERGGYVVTCDGNPDVVLVASGSEVSTLCEVAEVLRAEGRRVRVVSVPSEGLFRIQDVEYQNEVLPQGVKRFGLTAGLPVNLEGLVGAEGCVFGLQSFGYSAPYKVLEEKLGFTVEQIAEKVRNFLG